MPVEYTPLTLVQPVGSSAFAATIPQLTDDADIVVTLSDYHDNIAWYLSDMISKTSTSSQTIASPITFSGSTITLSGASITISGTSLSISSTVSISGAATFTGSLIAQNGVRGDILASNGTTTVLDNGTGGALSSSGSSITGYDAVFAGTAAAARSASLYKLSPGTGANNYLEGVAPRRIFVGADQPTGPGLQAGDIWMW